MAHQTTDSAVKEWMLKTSENSIKYIVDLWDMDKKVESFQPGMKLQSKAFKVGRSIFFIEIFPGGRTTWTKDVSVFLRSKSGWCVKTKVVASLPRKNITQTINEYMFQPEPPMNSSLGFPGSNIKRATVNLTARLL